MYAKLERIKDPYEQDLFGETCIVSDGNKFYVAYLDSEDGWLTEIGYGEREIFPTHFLKLSLDGLED